MGKRDDQRKLLLCIKKNASVLGTISPITRFGRNFLYLEIKLYYV
jgi:hypothetical protein